MFTRRSIFAGAAALCLLPAVALAQSQPVTLADLQAEFNTHPADTRSYLQQGLQGNGYYRGGIDGAWGPGTAAAYQQLMNSPKYRTAAARWEWDHKISVIETLFFLTTDAYEGEGSEDG